MHYAIKEWLYRGHKDENVAPSMSEPITSQKVPLVHFHGTKMPRHIRIRRESLSQDVTVQTIPCSVTLTLGTAHQLVTAVMNVSVSTDDAWSEPSASDLTGEGVDTPDMGTVWVSLVGGL